MAVRPTDAVRPALTQLGAAATPKDRDNLARFGIVTPTFLGVSVANIRAVAKDLGRDHALALGLWATGVYEARMLAAFVADPAAVTPALMDRWCRDFDNWGITDTVCFHLFDRTPHAFAKVRAWATHKAEFQKRAAFALLASVALHDKKAADEPFLECLPLAEAAAADGRNFVKKGVVWALRGVAGRNERLFAAASDIAHRLAQSDHPAERWVGATTARELRSSVTQRRRAKQTD